MLYYIEYMLDDVAHRYGNNDRFFRYSYEKEFHYALKGNHIWYNYPPDNVWCLCCKYNKARWKDSISD